MEMQVPGNLNDLKALVKQFEMFLPEDKRSVIAHTIAQLEESGGSLDEVQMQKLLASLMQSLGLSSMQK